MFKLGDTVQIIKPDLEICDDRLDQNAVNVLKAANFVGEITQMQYNLIYVGFKQNGVWLTQVFKKDELKKVIPHG